MTLFEQWKDLIENQTEETFRDFWEEYSGAETKIYSEHPGQAGRKNGRNSGRACCKI